MPPRGTPSSFETGSLMGLELRIRLDLLASGPRDCSRASPALGLHAHVPISTWAPGTRMLAALCFQGNNSFAF